MRIDSVMFRKCILIREALFTLPKPLVHFSRHLVNIVIEGSIRRVEQALRNLVSVLTNFLSSPIPNPSNRAVVMIAVEQKTLQVIHLVLLTLVHHLCILFCFHRLGPALDLRIHSLSINHRSAKHIPVVVRSGILKKESIASPKVTRVGSRDLATAMTIQLALTRLQQITTIMIPSENRTLHLSATLSLLHPVTSASSPVPTSTTHGNPLANLEAISLGLHLDNVCL